MTQTNNGDNGNYGLIGLTLGSAGIVTVILSSLAKKNWAVDDRSKNFLHLIVIAAALDIAFSFGFVIPYLGLFGVIALIALLSIILSKNNKSKWDSLKTYDNSQDNGYTTAMFVFVIICLIKAIFLLLGAVGATFMGSVLAVDVVGKILKKRNQQQIARKYYDQETQTLLSALRGRDR